MCPTVTRRGSDARAYAAVAAPSIAANAYARAVAEPIFARAETEETAMLDEPRLLAAHPWVTRRPITVTEYHRMGEVGILGDRDRVELIEGELVAMSPIGSYHHGTVNKLNHALVQAVGERAVVSVQGPVRLDEFSEPEPDFALLKPRPDFYQDAHAGPADVLMLIEVADTSLNYDPPEARALRTSRHSGTLDRRSHGWGGRSLPSTRGRRLRGDGTCRP